MGATNLRGFTYQAIGQLAQRQPTLLSRLPGVVSQLFAALPSEVPAVRPAVQEALSALVPAYIGCSGNASSHQNILKDKLSEVSMLLLT